MPRPLAVEASVGPVALGLHMAGLAAQVAKPGEWTALSTWRVSLAALRIRRVWGIAGVGSGGEGIGIGILTTFTPSILAPPLLTTFLPFPHSININTSIPTTMIIA